MAQSRPPIYMQSRGISTNLDIPESTSSTHLTFVQTRDAISLDVQSPDLMSLPLHTRDTLSVDVEPLDLDMEIMPSSSIQPRGDISIDVESLDLDMLQPLSPMDTRDTISVDLQSVDLDMPRPIESRDIITIDLRPNDLDSFKSDKPLTARNTISAEVESLELDVIQPSVPMDTRDTLEVDVASMNPANLIVDYSDSGVSELDSRDTVSVGLQSEGLDILDSPLPMRPRDSISINIQPLDMDSLQSDDSLKTRGTLAVDIDSQDLVDVEADTSEIEDTNKLGPRTIGVGGKFTIPAKDLPPTLYDRSSRNPFSPFEPEDPSPSDAEVYEPVEPGEATMTEDDRGRDDIAYETYEDDAWYDDEPSEPTMTVPWLMPRRTDGSFSARTLSRRGFLGDHVVGLDAGINGHAGDIGLPSVRPSPTPMSEDIRPGLGASIALSVIIGLVALVLTVFAGLKYRRKKHDLGSSEREKTSGRDDEGEDEDAFTGPSRTGNDTEIDEEKGLKSPAASAMGDTPHAKKGFRLWSPLPLFSPSRSRSRSREPDTPPPTRRAVLCSPSPVFTSLRTSSPGPSPSPVPSPAPSPLSRSAIPRGDTVQSLMDALDSPLPLALDTIDEGEEEVSLRSRPSIKDLHNRLSTASTSDSIRRLSATSTYSTCSERSSVYEVHTEESHTYERSNSVSSESSDSSSAYLETPVRIQTPVITDETGGNRFEQAGGLLLPTMPSAASIHEALDDMIGLFSPPPGGAQKTAVMSHGTGIQEEEELDALAKAAEAIGKVAFAQLQKTAQTQSGPSITVLESPARPIRPHNPLIKNPLFSLGEEEEESEPSWTPVAEKQLESPRPAPPTRRHTLPIALLSRRSSIPPSSKPEQRYSELYSKDHLQRALSGIRSRQNSLPTVSESESSGPSSFVQAAYKFTASMGAEKIQLQQRRMTLTTKYENAMAMARPTTPEQQEQTPERLALAKFLASVADTEDDDEDDFTPYWGSEDETDSRWLVYEENFPLPESGLPQIMVTCH